MKNMQNKTKIDTFSANSLEILNNSKEEFYNKYILNLELIVQNNDIKLGNKFHNLICYYLKNHEIKKFENALNDKEKILWENIKNSKIAILAKSAGEKFIEQPFFIKEYIENKPFYLTGRFDAIVKIDDKYIILDWKINNIPKNYEDTMQTLVYLHCASRLYKTNNVEMIYYSLMKNEFKKIQNKGDAFKKIKEVIKKIY